MVGVCLLFIGVDRVLVVLFPIKYFRNQRFSVVTQAVAAHIFIIALFGVTVFFSGMRNVGHVSLRCRLVS
uniref:G_PROTEIN_RECEP_F1_2 domain-containing protein n=1 Tax=Syphacia muris TaxID=451379 RepID=A0A0N5AIP8_9BILA